MDAAIDHDLTAELARLRQELDACQRQLAEQAEALRANDHTDALTGALTRRGFRATLGASPGGGVAIVDIDRFRRINGRHGHSVGDEALVHCSRAIHQIAPKGSTVARWGAGEFAVHLDTTDADRCVSIVEAMRRTVADSPLRIVGDSVAMTVSIGLALPDDCSDLEGQLKRAGEELHRAKACGRDRVRTTARSTPSPLRS